MDAITTHCANVVFKLPYFVSMMILIYCTEASWVVNLSCNANVLNSCADVDVEKDGITKVTHVVLVHMTLFIS